MPQPKSRQRFLPFLLAAIMPAALMGCATRPPASDPDAVAEYEANNDPAEPWNRGVYQVNEGIDTVLLRPAAVVYRAVLPQPVRTGVRNVLQNLSSPVTLINDALQGETDRFGTTLGRFVLNTTLGVGGIFEVAESFGLPRHTEDTGQTLATWGVGEGPYLFLPLLGPSNPRDLGGYAADIAMNPFTWVLMGSDIPSYVPWVRTGLTIVDAREAVLDTLDSVKQTSLDPYATIRSAYRQSRNREISNPPVKSWWGNPFAENSGKPAAASSAP